ncbi:leucine-rich repeat-containing protein 51-like [Diadema antillarum]|uniref:leucine-rich repeat-containing protein 51-like n=1 Tax=Diadema antillarum TaxID=105358 RepID=UPI003A88A7D9
MSGVKSPRDTSAAIDATNEYGPPLDYSYIPLTSFLDAGDEVPRKGQQKVMRTKEGKYRSTSLKFNYNALTDFEGFQGALEGILETPSDLSSLDLSFNDFTKIDPVLLEYPNLKMLYLHGNHIDKLEEIDKLAALPNLISLTVHGNLIEDLPGFRSYILSRLPKLKTLNFSGVTKADLTNAATWKTMYGRKKTKRRPKDDA